MPILVLPFAWTCILLGLQVARRERLGEQVNPAKPSVTGADTADRSATANLAPGSGRIEFFNDDATPMEFVVNVLSDHLQLDRQAAINYMLGIHRTGSILIPCASYVDAARIVALISAQAREAGHPLRCQVAMHP
jgi:ATP-dependent Clp protease adaptor protein ClpS